jgi:hypothetical protein
MELLSREELLELFRRAYLALDLRNNGLVDGLEVFQLAIEVTS